MSSIRIVIAYIFCNCEQDQITQRYHSVFIWSFFIKILGGFIMTVVGARIDNRLLHGIVATTWVPESSASRVMVIDDEVAENPVLKDTMKLGRPSGVAVSIITRETALTNFKSGKYDNQKVFIISKTPEIYLNLIKQGTNINKVVLGGTLTYEDGIKITNRAYMLKEEIPIYKEMTDFGTEVVSAYTTNDDQVDVFKILDKKISKEDLQWD